MMHILYNVSVFKVCSICLFNSLEYKHCLKSGAIIKKDYEQVQLIVTFILLPVLGELCH